MILSHAIAEATAEGKPATIAVMDRTGSVLAVYEMTGSNNPPPAGGGSLRYVTIAHNDRGPDSGLNGVAVPAAAAAISKAATAAYLSSGGNAFSTRTASQIVQDHYNPGVANTPSGPLFGVQFSALPCSDVNVRVNPGDPSSLTRGPKRAPLGLAGDPGGFPLYKSGEMVGAIGVMADGIYGVDENIFDVDHDPDEIVALAGTVGYDAPASIKANMITVGGLTLRYSDATSSDFAGNPAAAPAFASISPSVGSLISVAGYYNAGSGILNGVTYGTAASGLRADTTGYYSTVVPPLLLVDGNNNNRYPVVGGTGPLALTADEVQHILRDGYQFSLIERAQIRQPLGSVAAITVSVVDANGTILGSVTNPDAPVFGIDVSIQKARTAVFMSGVQVHDFLNQGNFLKYLTASQNFFGENVLDGSVAFSARAVGNLERDTYPDGIFGTPNGPFSPSYNSFTPFADGLQEELVENNIVQHVTYIATGGATPDTPAACTSVPAGPSSLTGVPVLADGSQVFPGGFPIYRNGVLIGGAGVSGDGVDQDDMTAFLAIFRASVEMHTGFGEAPVNRRIDQFDPQGARPRYVNCPYSPLLNSSVQNLCDGK